MSRIKICGLSRIEDIAAVNEVLPDYIGFVFAESRRQISYEKARLLKDRLNPAIQAVGVFVNEDIGQIVSLCDNGIIDLVQLHGDETVEYVNLLRSLIPNPVIKAVRVRSTEDIMKAEEFPSDYLLLDAYHEDMYGGSGKTFDWSLIKAVKKPFFLAGGIHSDNILDAQSSCQPYCIDVSSGVETDGWKDPEKIRGIVRGIKVTVK